MHCYCVQCILLFGTELRMARRHEEFLSKELEAQRSTSGRRYVCIYVYVCVCVSMFVSVSVSVSMSVSVSVSVYVYGWVGVCV